MSQQIVQVAGNALALGHLGQMLDLVICDSKLLCRAVADAAVMGHEPHYDDQQHHRNPKWHRQVKAVGIDGKDGNVQCHQQGYPPKACGKASRGDCIDEQAGPVFVDRYGEGRHQHHRGYCVKTTRFRAGERVQIQPNEEETIECVSNPQQRSSMPPERIEEEPDHEGKPDERKPAMLIIAGIKLPPDCFKRGHGSLGPIYCRADGLAAQPCTKLRRPL